MLWKCRQCTSIITHTQSLCAMLCYTIHTRYLRVARLFSFLLPNASKVSIQRAAATREKNPFWPSIVFDTVKYTHRDPLLFIPHHNPVSSCISLRQCATFQCALRNTFDTFLRMLRVHTTSEFFNPSHLRKERERDIGLRLGAVLSVAGSIATLFVGSDNGIYRFGHKVFTCVWFVHVVPFAFVMKCKRTLP